MRIFPRILLALFLLCCMVGLQNSSADTVNAQQTLAPLLDANSPDAIPGEYIVVFKANTSAQAAVASRSRATTTPGATVRAAYSQGLKGFSATLSPAALQSVRLDPNVAYVSVNQVVYAAGSQFQTQNPVPAWGLDRIDQRTLPLNGIYDNRTGATGKGVDVYVMDTGIRITHEEFGGRARPGKNFYYDNTGYDPNSTDDCHGHGTHVSGIIGGKTYGVAKEVNLISARVLNCQNEGRADMILTAIDWIVAERNRIAQDPRFHPMRTAVVNMSFRTGDSRPLKDSIRDNTQLGNLIFVVAAGNIPPHNPQLIDACLRSPANAPEAITVAASSPADRRWTGSMSGRCVDLFAPGEGIRSAYVDILGAVNTSTLTLPGTSQAAPHVAGVIALYLQLSPYTNAAQMANILISNSTQGVLQDVGVGSPNRLLYLNFFPAVPGPTPTPNPCNPPNICNGPPTPPGQ